MVHEKTDNLQSTINEPRIVIHNYIFWKNSNGVDLENTAYPKYLGVTLDRTLSYKQHILNTKMKVATRNNLLKKIANSKWGTNARTIRTTALALCYSTAEYAAPVWARSSHANKLNPVLNQACRSITGCLKPTNVEDIYLIAGIAPPDIRREVCARVERTNQTKDERLFVWPHPSTGASEVTLFCQMYNQWTSPQRLYGVRTGEQDCARNHTSM